LRSRTIKTGPENGAALGRQREAEADDRKSSGCKKTITMTRFLLNDREVATDLPKGTLLLDFIRYQRHLTGTKVGCREGDCGACTVLVGKLRDGRMEYHSVTSCLMPIGNAQGRHIVTVEGVNTEGLNFVQQAFADEGAAQCGFCTPGFIVSLAGFSLRSETPTPEKGIDAVNGNICRCTGYKSIERAIRRIAEKLGERSGAPALEFAVDNGFLPTYFKDVPQRMKRMAETKTEESVRPGVNARFLGGGTDLYVQQHDAMAETDIRFLADRSDLKGIRQRGSLCEIGAAATVTDFATSPILQKAIPSLPSIIRWISSEPIRNMATLAGNLVNASPIGDFNILFLALDAVLTLSDDTVEREVPLRRFYRGYKTLAKRPEEYVVKISFRLPEGGTQVNFEKVCKRTHLDIASVNSALCIKTGDGIILEAGLAVGGVGPVPLFLERTSAFLKGRPVNDATVTQACTIAQTEAKPIGDVRGSIAYKRLLMEQLVKAHFIRLFPNAVRLHETASA
jgi:xanthine dehydrogenase small subunit